MSLEHQPTVWAPSSRRPLLGDIPWIEILGGLVIAGAAAGLGYQIAHERWLYFGAALMLGLVLIWPVEIALGSFAFLVPFDAIAALGKSATGTTLNWFVGAMAAAILLGTGMVHRRLKSPPDAAFWWTLFIAWAAASTLWAIEPQYAIERLPTAAALFVLFLAAVSFRPSQKELSRVSWCAIAGGTAAAAYAIRSFAHGFAFSSRLSLISGSREADPNQFAAALLLPLALAIGEVISPKKMLSRLMMLGAVCIMTLATFLSMSRGAILALAVVVFFFLIRYRVNWRVLVPVTLLVCLLMAMPSLFFSRFQESEASRGAGRLDIWEAGARVLTHYGVIGAGLDQFPVAYQQYAGTARVFRGYNRAAHNIYLCMWVETGLVGMYFLFRAFGSHFRAARRLHAPIRKLLPSRLASYEAACWGMLTAGFFLDIMWRKGFWLSWTLLAMAVQVRRDAKESA